MYQSNAAAPVKIAAVIGDNGAAMSRITWIAALLAWATLTGGTSLRAADNVTWRVDGQTREAIVHAPTGASSAGASPAPIVFAFHGFGDDARNFQYVDLHRAWPEAVVVYFQGLPRRANMLGWQVERGQDDDRDLKLVDLALSSLRKQYRVDDRRVYATGFSNGAMLTYLLWAERPQVFAAFAPVAGRVRPSIQPTVRRPLLHVGGTRDTVVAFEDQKAAFELAMRVNGVADQRAPCGDGCAIYGARTAAPVVVSTHDGAHTYPRGTSERIVEFFRAHQR